MQLTTGVGAVVVALSLVGGGLAVALDAGNQCAAQPTVYVTVPGPTVTHFIEVQHNRNHDIDSGTALGPAQDTRTRAGGPYMFTEHGGSTVWLGAPLPASITNFVKHTSVVVVTPVPSPTATYTSYTTRTSTITVYPSSADHTPPNYGASSSVTHSGSLSSEIDTTVHLTHVTTVLATLSSAGPTSIGVSTYDGVPTTGWNISTSSSPEQYGYGPGTTVGTVSHISSWDGAASSSVYATLTFVVSSTTSVVTIPVGPSGNLSSSSVHGTGHSSETNFPTSIMSILPYPAPSWIGTSHSSSSGVLPSGFPTSIASILPYPAPSWLTVSSFRGTGSSSALVSSQISSSTSPSLIFPPTPTPAVSSGSSIQVIGTSTSFSVSFSSTHAVPSSLQTNCGEVGDFTITWDDLPVLNPTDNSTVLFPPVFSPYHHLFYANGYAYIKEAWANYEASSEPDIAIFLPNTTRVAAASGKAKPGEIGAGPRMSDSAHWFNAYNVSVGCDNQGPQDCLMTISAYKYDKETDDEVLSGQQYVNVPPCAQTRGCQLTQVTFPEEFRGLSGIQFEATVQTPKKSIFMLDSLAVGWFDNSCAAGLSRTRVRK